LLALTTAVNSAMAANNICQQRYAVLFQWQPITGAFVLTALLAARWQQQQQQRY
jgi:hypothetical protein